MKKNISYIGVVFSILSCSARPPALRTGDLLFQVGAESEMTGAIVAATDGLTTAFAVKGNREQMPAFTHVGIAIAENAAVRVIEATGHGVRKTFLEEFLNRSQLVGGKPAVVVMRLRDTTGVAAAVRRAEGFAGQPYDYSYLPDNGKMYCSELIYESYLAADGTHRFTARPMNFRAADGTLPRFWAELFERLGEPVPEGIPGTNPNDMAQEEILEHVYRFF